MKCLEKKLILNSIGIGLTSLLILSVFLILGLPKNSDTADQKYSNNLDSFEISNSEDYKFYMNNIEFLDVVNFFEFDNSGNIKISLEHRSNDQFYCLLSYSPPFELIRGLDQERKIKLERYLDGQTASAIRNYVTPFRYGQIETRAILVISDRDFKILDFNSPIRNFEARSFTLNDQVDDGCIYAKGSTVRVKENVIAFSGRV